MHVLDSITPSLYRQGTQGETMWHIFLSLSTGCYWLLPGYYIIFTNKTSGMVQSQTASVAFEGFQATISRLLGQRMEHFC